MKAIEDFVATNPKRLNKIVKMDLFNFVYFLRDHKYIDQEVVDKIWGSKD